MDKKIEPDISVIVCTHNRQELLSKCLLSLNKQSYPSNKLEIVIIDNNSTDNTKIIVQKYTKKAKFACKYVFEPRIGLSQAKNTGIRNSRRKIVAFIDDDAVACKNWVKNIVNCFSKEEIWAVGGQVKPKFEITPPEWIPQRYFFVLGVCDSGRKIAEVPDIAGGNSAFRKEVFKKIGLFRTALGHKGRKLLAGEELDFCTRITQAGGKIFYTPKAIIYHWTPKERLTRKYFIKRIFMEGVTLVKLEKLKKENKSILFECLRLFLFFKRYLFGRKFEYCCDIYFHLGYLYGRLTS